MTEVTFNRGAVYLANIPEMDEPKYFVVVSNNNRNWKLKAALCAKINTRSKYGAQPTIIPIEDHFLDGYVMCDDLFTLFEEDVIKGVPGFTPYFMQKVDRGLRHALALTCDHD